MAKKNGWTDEDIVTLVSEFKEGKSVREVAIGLERSEEEVTKMRQKILILVPGSLPALRRQHKLTRQVSDILNRVL